MKRLIILLLMLAVAGSTTEAYSQSWLKSLGKKAEEAAKRAVERNVENQVEKTVNNAFEKSEEAVKGNNNNTNNNNNAAYEQAMQQQQAAQQAAMQQQAAGQQAAQAPQQSLEMTYAKSDFVAGDEIFFDDTQENEQMGEFPSQWDLLEGVAEIAAVNGVKAIVFPADGKIAPLMKDMESYLPEKFTLELDYWRFENNYSYSYELSLYDGDKRVLNLQFGNTYMSWWYYPSNSDDDRSGSDDSIFPTVENVDAWNHLALSFNQRAMKVYVNGTRIANIPNMQAPKRWHFRAFRYQPEYLIGIKGVRMAKGAVPLYDRMMSDGKFITYGITFDVGKSTIKPESMGEINRIVQLMTENPDLKFSVEGHTDSTGNSANNQTLSEQRSQAIVAKLVEMGIAQDRLTAVGKGQNNPIADNGTDEGRAKNRRVEFVKI